MELGRGKRGRVVVPPGPDYVWMMMTIIMIMIIMMTTTV